MQNMSVVLAVALAAGLVAFAADEPRTERKRSGDRKTLGRTQRAGTHEQAFATIGGARYAAFYGRLIGPHAVVAGERVYCAIQDSRGRPVIDVYDTKAKRWHGPVTASRHGIRRGDSHGNPALCIDRGGHLHVFYGCHGGAMRHTRSVKPHDIGAWKERPSPAASFSRRGKEYRQPSPR